MCVKTETNGALGPTVTYTVDSGVLGLVYQRKTVQQLATGALIQVMEDHCTIPATATLSDGTQITPEHAVKVAGTDGLSNYYDITDVNRVDQNLKILLDLTLKRVRV